MPWTTTHHGLLPQERTRALSHYLLLRAIGLTTGENRAKDDFQAEGDWDTHGASELIFGRAQRRYDGDPGTCIVFTFSSEECVNMNSSPLIAILFAIFVLPAVALADQHVRAQLDHSGIPSIAAKASNKGPLKHEQTISVRGTVESIDPKTRLLMLKTEDGRTLDVHAGDEVKNFDKVAVGDVVKATYTQSVVFQILPRGETQGDASQRVDPITGRAKVGQKATSTFEVASVDPIPNIAWMKLPNGNTKPIFFDEATKSGLRTLRRGDVISATYTESAATELKKLAE